MSVPGRESIPSPISRSAALNLNFDALIAAEVATSLRVLSAEVTPAFPYVDADPKSFVAEPIQPSLLSASCHPDCPRVSSPRTRCSRLLPKRLERIFAEYSQTFLSPAISLSIFAVFTFAYVSAIASIYDAIDAIPQ